jgi:RHS repeat-associated protein
MKNKFVLALLPLGLFATSNLFGQVGNDNPTGVSGAFSNIITTGGAYVPYTGNATRIVPDMIVDGAVGTIPLQLTRIYNSRGTAPRKSFGQGSPWQHNYNWNIPDSGKNVGSAPPMPTSYEVDFPDGRVETFGAVQGDSYYHAAPGTHERFVPFSASLGYLILEDGSKVEFKATLKHDANHTPSYWWNFTAQALIDPFGQRTSITYDTNGNVLKVTEPAGRYLQFYYTTVGGLLVVDHVTSSASRTVQYSYLQSTFSPGTTTYTVLDHIVYFGDSQWTAQYTYQAPNVGSASGQPLLWKCNDPMYAGPMKWIAYTYRTSNNSDGSSPVYGQISSENYYNATTDTVGAAVTTLAVNGSTRTETRGDGTHPTRTFTYTIAKLTSQTDFLNHNSSQTYDGNSYLSSVTDANGHTTDFTINTLTGSVLTTTFPATPGDTPPTTPRGVVTYTYGWANCPDSNNRDANNPYYLYSVTDEGGHTTTYTRDTSKRVTQINYPDGGSESFTYNSFGQVLSHVMKTGGTESFTYDASGVKQTYRDPYHDPINQTGNPSAWYTFDSVNKLSQVTDTLGTATHDVYHTTSFAYNARGQLTATTKPVDPVDGQRHTIANVYNADGTVASTTDELGHVTSSTYDDYKRPLSKTTPLRFTGDTLSHTASIYYDTTGTGNDYTHTDANVTHLVLPGGEKTTTTYDVNFRKTSLTVGDGTADAATTTFSYDNVGNVTTVKAPKEQPGQPYAGQSTATTYDERNRIVSATDALGNVTSCSYDTAGRKAKATRANGQTITYDSYDAMNRLLQQTIKQTPDPDAVTKYTYNAAGSLATMQDPRLVANNSTYNYGYAYDQMGRKTQLTYPPDSGNVQRTEIWHYDTAGRTDTFTNRVGNVQTITYDALNRPTTVSWNDNGITPTVTATYDIGSRLTSVVNANATVSRTYFNDNLLNTETSTYADSTARTVTYTYDADARRATIQYPNGAYSFTYGYTARNQVRTIANTSPSATIMTDAYDLDGNLTTRTPDNSTTSTYTYDGLDRVTNISHALSGTTRTLDYAYDNVSNRKWQKRDSGNGDVFGYDQNDQSISVLLNVANPDTTSPGSQTINYDANGNRTSFSAYGSNDTYTINNLNQYSGRNSNQATYDGNGNMTTGVDSSIYTYDAQNRLLTATKAGVTDTFTYDGLNRQVTKKIGTGAVTYNVYDGWLLIGEYAGGASSPSSAYLSGAGGLIKNLTSNLYFYQDASGSTSHLADNSGHLIEWYRYDLHGTPLFYNSVNTQIGASNYSVRHLFTGQEWYSEIGLYNLRARFYSPDIGRFLQADPSGFNGDATNLYRYCGNNPLTHIDPSGMGEKRGDQGPRGGDLINQRDGIADFNSNWGSLCQDLGNPYSLAGFVMDGVSGVTLDQAEFAYSMASYGTSLGSVYAGYGIFIGAAGIATQGEPIRRPTAYRLPTRSGTASADGYSLGFIWSESGAGAPEIITDADLSANLKGIYDYVNANNVSQMSYEQFIEFIVLFDTRYYGDSTYLYTGNLAGYNGSWSGYQINYIGVGEAFAAYGWSVGSMNMAIAEWTVINGYSLFDLPGKIGWASVGYNYYKSPWGP